MKIRVYYEDTDAGGIVYHTNYIKYCERARSEIFFQNSVSLENDGAFFVVRDINAHFLSSAKLGDLLHIETKLTACKSASLELRQEIYKDEKLIFYADIRVAYIKDGRPAKISEELRKLFLSL